MLVRPPFKYLFSVPQQHIAETCSSVLRNMHIVVENYNLKTYENFIVNTDNISYIEGPNCFSSDSIYKISFEDFPDGKIALDKLRHNKEANVSIYMTDGKNVIWCFDSKEKAETAIEMLVESSGYIEN